MKTQILIFGLLALALCACGKSVGVQSEADVSVSTRAATMCTDSSGASHVDGSNWQCGCNVCACDNGAIFSTQQSCGH